MRCLIEAEVEGDEEYPPRRGDRVAHISTFWSGEVTKVTPLRSPEEERDSALAALREIRRACEVGLGGVDPIWIDEAIARHGITLGEPKE